MTMNANCWDESRKNWHLLDATPRALLLFYRITASIGFIVFVVFGVINLAVSSDWSGWASCGALVISAFFAVMAKRASRLIGTITIVDG